MKKLTVLVLVLAFLLSLSGCASGRYKGWEYVRIEKRVPNTNCEYKIQDTCSGAGANCYNYYKQEATLYGANTVVITEDVRSQRSSGAAAAYNGAGGASFKSAEVMTTLADYYACPPYKPGEKK